MEFTTSELLVSAFEAAGIRDAFVVTGGAISGFTEALAKSTSIQKHYLLTEQSASIAAEAYGQYDGKPALLVVTSGPGVTNALTGVAAAWTNSSPVVVVSGQARTIDVIEASRVLNRQIGNQHVPTMEFAKPITKFCMEPTELFNVSEIVDLLVRSATSGRFGPVWLSLPSDLQRMKNSRTLVEKFISPEVKDLHSEITILRQKIIKLFNGAKKPAILIGNGSRREGRLPVEILNFIRDSSLPSLTTWPGMDLIDDSLPEFYGRPGTIASSYVANLMVQNCDALLILGARLDLAQVGFRPNSFAKNAQVLRVDVDQLEFARIPPRQNWENFIGSISTLSEAFKDLKLNVNREWINQLSEWRGLSINRSIGANDKLVSTYQVIQELGKFKIDNVVSGSSGTCIEMVLQQWSVKEHQRFVFSCGLGSMGFGLASAIGVAIKTEKPVLLIESDGSLAMNIQDFETIAKMKLNVKIVILNSLGYKSIKLSQNRSGQLSHGIDSSSGLFLPEVIKWSNAAGISSRKVDAKSRLQSGLNWLKDTNEPRLLDVHVSASEEAIPRLLSKVNESGLMETREFDDLWPENE
jgi:acetolactate synthase I/II/III large subunit